jgi:8-oxo-dGTP pyrophosphatase MutT (NUDIX family)
MMITCGMYLFVLPTKRLLACHATRAPLSQWSIPKGLPDPGEGLLEAATRELLEETNIRLSAICVLELSQLPPVKYQKQNKILESFLVITDADFGSWTLQCNSHTPQGYPEIDRWKWVTLGEAVTTLHESQAKNLEEIERRINRTLL